MSVITKAWRNARADLGTIYLGYLTAVLLLAVASAVVQTAMTPVPAPRVLRHAGCDRTDTVTLASLGFAPLKGTFALDRSDQVSRSPFEP